MNEKRDTRKGTRIFNFLTIATKEGGGNLYVRCVASKVKIRERLESIGDRSTFEVAGEKKREKERGRLDILEKRRGKEKGKDMREKEREIEKERKKGRGEKRKGKEKKMIIVDPVIIFRG